MAGFADRFLPRMRNASDGGPEVEEIRVLTNQFYVSLRAYLTGIESHERPDHDPALQRVRQLAEKPVEDRTWHDAYDLEQQLVLLFDDQTLETELDRRLIEARGSLPPDVVKWYEQAIERSNDIPEKRALLIRLVNDIQWRYTKDEARRGYTKQITERTEWVFAVTVILFSITILLVVFGSAAVKGGDLARELLLLPFVATAGAFGAAFSMMISLRTRLRESAFDDLKLNRSWGLILARILVGSGASFVFFFFVSSGLLSGDAFPTPEPQAAAETGPILFTTYFAKLFLWSFLSGFSEKLVPNLLSRTAAEAAEPAQLPPPAPSSPARTPTSPDRPEAVGQRPEATGPGKAD